MEGGIYLVVGPAVATEALAARLAAGGVACVELDPPDAAAAARLRPLVQDRDIAFLLAHDAALAATNGCDGVRVDGADAYAAARAAVGDDAIVGVATGTSRHEAMVAGEAGADFVLLAPELVSWWTELMEVPVVAATAGADFVIERL